MLCIFPLLIIAYYPVASIILPYGFKLELVQTLFRHGDRTPNSPQSYPNDPYNSSNYDIYGYGQLTNDGRKRMYELGQMFKQRYGEILSETYKPQDIYAYSTDIDRTKASLQLVLAGLFPPSPQETWNSQLKWLPFPTYYNDAKFDFLSTTYYCTEVERAHRRVVSSSEVQKKLLNYKNFLEYISQSTGLPLDPNNGLHLFNAIRAQRNLNLPYPPWCSDQVFEQLKEIAAFTIETYTYTNELRSLVAGPTIKRFLTNIENNELKTDKRKMYLYSAHDTNINTILGSFNFYQNIPLADYGTALIIEKLKGQDENTYIRLLLYSSIDKTLTPLVLKSCTEICPLSMFINMMNKIAPDNPKCLYANARRNVEHLINGTIKNDDYNKLKLKYK
ncbi:PREDICTED: venom acid phosphatase Acph-1-like [Ceratosolen solmsi marchali]|uniref:acid phosphatase n=1 Tax=Ceratosolen solmsi marchali TaxID=326594 RepID=A0AAJ7DTW1_9HYME|nr:PREDICTED: venom acid phosphatase Acph-1-like [Ceratosolen solmsi marchali]